MNADHDHVNKDRIPIPQRKVHPVRNRLGKTKEQLVLLNKLVCF